MRKDPEFEEGRDINHIRVVQELTAVMVLDQRGLDQRWYWINGGIGSARIGSAWIGSALCATVNYLMITPPPPIFFPGSAPAFETRPGVSIYWTGKWAVTVEWTCAQKHFSMAVSGSAVWLFTYV